jgi:predicted permease
MLLSAFLNVLLPVLLVAGCGFALARAVSLDLRSINRVSLYVLSPALIVATLARMQVAGDEALRIVAVSALFVLAMGALTLLCAAPLRLDRAGLAALLLCTMFMNAGNFGLPTTRLAFGDAGFQRGVLFFIPQTILAQVLAIPIARADQGDLRGAFRQIFRMPQIYAAAAGVLLAISGVRLDGRADVVGALFRGVALLADATLPFLLLILGMQLAQGIAVDQRGLTALAAGLRLLVSPLLALGLAWLLGLDGLPRRVVILQASMPTAVNMVLYSLEFGARPRFVAGTVVVTTALGVVTLAGLLTVLMG